MTKISEISDASQSADGKIAGDEDLRSDNEILEELKNARSDSPPLLQSKGFGPADYISIENTSRPIAIQPKQIYVLGGVGESSKLTTILRYDVASGRWQDLKVPLQLSRGGVYFDKDQQIFSIFGGRKDTHPIGKNYLYDLDTQDLTVEENSRVRVKRSGFGFLQSDSKTPILTADMVFIVGGNDGDSILKTTMCIKTDIGDTAVLPELNIARDELDIAMGR